MKILSPLLIVIFVLGGCGQSFNFERSASGGITVLNDYWQDYKRLTGSEIRVAFSDVLDRAVVIDGAGGTASNYWYKDGRFRSSWQVGGKAGQLEGFWFVENNQRCVTIDISSTEFGELKASPHRCGPIYSKDGKYFSANKFGRVHGAHVVTELTPAQLDASRLAD